MGKRYDFCNVRTLYQSGPLDEFLTEELPFGDKKPCVHITSDVSTLLNQKRIDRDLAPAVNEILSNVRSSDVSDKFGHLSDEEILSCVKSRYIQAPSELIDWSEYLQSQLGHLSEQAQMAAEEQAQKAEESSEQGDGSV